MRNFFINLIFFIPVVCVSTTDYCNLKSCSDPRKHVMCLYKDEALSDACAHSTETGFTADQKNQLLKIHNRIRDFQSDDVGVVFPTWKWDEELETLAQRWANQCQNHTDECRSTYDDSTVYQNIDATVYSYSDEYKPSTEIIYLDGIVMNSWYLKDNAILNPSDNKYFGLERIGCGGTRSKKCSSDVNKGSHCTLTSYIVCNYSY